jgi:hypothetical protein
LDTCWRPCCICTASSLWTPAGGLAAAALLQVFGHLLEALLLLHCFKSLDTCWVSLAAAALLQVFGHLLGEPVACSVVGDVEVHEVLHYLCWGSSVTLHGELFLLICNIQPASDCYHAGITRLCLLKLLLLNQQ